MNSKCKGHLSDGCAACDLESRLFQIQAEIKKSHFSLTSTVKELDTVKAENERIGNIAVQYEQDIDSLLVENARYRVALTDIASHCCHPDCNHQEVAKSAFHPVVTERPETCFCGGSDQVGHNPTLGHDTHRPPEPCHDEVHIEKQTKCDPTNGHKPEQAECPHYEYLNCGHKTKSKGGGK